MNKAESIWYNELYVLRSESPKGVCPVHKKNRVVVRILGQEYKLVSDEPQEYMQQVANYVDGKMMEIAEGNKKLTTAMIAVLTCLNIADEYYKLNEDKADIEKNLQFPSHDLETLHQRLKGVSEELDHRNRDYEKMLQDFEVMMENSTAYEEELHSLREKMNMLSYELSSKEEMLMRSNSTIRDLRRQVPHRDEPVEVPAGQPERDGHWDSQLSFEDLEE